MSDTKTAKVTLATDCAPQSAAGDGAGYRLEPGVEVEGPVSVAVGLTDHPLITVIGVPKKVADAWRIGQPDPEPDDSSTDDPGDAPTMGDDDDEGEA